MATNLKKGSKVSFNVEHGHKRIGKVIRKYTAPKGSVNVPSNKRTLVWVKSSGQTFSKRPSQLKRV